jgi:hypothetical protein
MNKTGAVCLAIIFISSCTSYRNVQVVESVPERCELLKTIGVLQCSNGSLAKSSLRNATLELKKIAATEDGDTITCCWQDDEELITAGYDSKTGKINCVGFAMYWGNIYSCDGTSKLYGEDASLPPGAQ